MSIINYLMNDVTPSKAMKIAAGFSIVQGVVMAKMLLNAGEAAHTNEERYRYMFDIVRRNTDKLDEFDIIALRELGLIKETP